jgi:hypothetical protein
MKQLLLLFVLISSLVNNKIVAQEYLLTLNGDNLNTYEYNTYPLKITNTQNISISGTFESDISVSIAPLIGYSIVLKPLSTNQPYSSNLILLPGNDTTSVKIKRQGTGDRSTTPSNIILFPNPVQTVLNFSVSNNLVSSFEIYNLNGILQNSQTINPPVASSAINVNNLIQGTYILKLNLTNGNQLTIQFIKN